MTSHGLFIIVANMDTSNLLPDMYAQNPSIWYTYQANPECSYYSYIM